MAGSVYMPPAYEQRDESALAALIHAHPLATIVAQQAPTKCTEADDAARVNSSSATDSVGAAAPWMLTANHIPLLFDKERRVLRGHVARANPLAKLAGQEVLVIFHGPHAYVSPSWYPSKAETHRAVPTWNYAVVHVRGVLATVEHPELLRTLHDLTHKHEGETLSHVPGHDRWEVSQAPVDYLQKSMSAIVGIEIAVRDMVGKFKLSQNRSTPDRLGVVRGLDAFPHERSDAHEVADAMRATLNAIDARAAPRDPDDAGGKTQRVLVGALIFVAAMAALARIRAN